ncbi:type II toxin-antitoxin system PemK/MazF family toxin [Clostridium swellfunianum]|uniref:type II toxin-antitoxin system PemK/MazF family toxin n=1 Tax=Clostridium swellfunianum TaxID=1367462 RepID=UPI00202F347E|nr:type II toxin-antitoxin system PemK/MazF family toxin [Clostridium swellfunianum]MCM0648616.1 type II toxin-antitoxin system PemK/MazF family toxin [Clostridium swellfunianum]
MPSIKDLIRQTKAMDELTVKRGMIYRVGFPFKVKAPLQIFNCCEEKCASHLNNCLKCKASTNVTCEECTKQKTMQLNGCKGYIGRYTKDDLLKISFTEKVPKVQKSIPLNSVVKVKVRPFLILSSNINVQAFDKDYLYGVPIKSLKEPLISDKTYMELLKTRNIPYKLYVDKIEKGAKKPSYIDLASIVTIHKNLIIDYLGFLEAEEMMYVSEQISILLDLNQFNNIDDLLLLQKQKENLISQLSMIETKINTLKHASNT